MMPQREETFLTPKEVVKRYRGRITEGTLANWRSTGQGPQYVKVGHHVLYPLSRLMVWEERRTLGAPREGEKPIAKAPAVRP